MQWKRQSAILLLLLFVPLSSHANSLPDKEYFIEIEKQYCRKHFEVSDINEYLPHLCRLAYECSSVVEIGLRSMGSTWGILLGLAENPAVDRLYLGIDTSSLLERAGLF